MGDRFDSDNKDSDRNTDNSHVCNTDGNAGKGSGFPSEKGNEKWSGVDNSKASWKK